MFHLHVQKVLPSHDVDALTVPSKTPPFAKGGWGDFVSCHPW